MVELKENKKAFNTEVKIYKSLRKLLLERPIEEITVADISSDCGVSRSSFYRNFKNIPDVLEATFGWYYKRYLDNRRSQINQFAYFFEYWINHRDLVKIMSGINTNMIKNALKKYNDVLANNPIQLDIKTAIFIAVLSYWSDNKNLSTEEMVNYARANTDKKAYDILIL